MLKLGNLKIFRIYLSKYVFNYVIFITIQKNRSNSNLSYHIMYFTFMHNIYYIMVIYKL